MRGMKTPKTATRAVRMICRPAIGEIPRMAAPAKIRPPRTNQAEP